MSRRGPRGSPVPEIWGEPTSPRGVRGVLYHKLARDKDGRVRLQDQPVELTQLADEVRALASLRPDVSVFVRADGDRPYRDVIEVMKEVRNGGISNVTLVTEPEGKNIR